jgi:hypothetical protein
LNACPLFLLGVSAFIIFLEPTMIPASDFSGLAWMILCIPLVLLAAAVLSFIPAYLGHWSAVVLALPAVVLGILFDSAIMSGGGGARMPPWACMMFLAPPVTGILAMGLWSEKRKTRNS